MPANRPELLPNLLQQEIQRLLPAVAAGRGRSNRQRKSELAALLFEAHRTSAPLTWGYKNLGSYARERLNLNRATFAKYKAAGKALAETMLYEELIDAVRLGLRRPRLPEVSELAALQSLEKQVGRDHATVSLLREGAALSKIKTLARMNAYGGAGPEARKLLGAIDGFTQDLRRGGKLIGTLLAGTTGIPANELARRLREVREECESVIGALKLIKAEG
jgi:hypothetical protein